jgi:hypothetical protein
MYQSFLCSFVLIAVFHGTFQAALDDYVFREDPNYHFEEIGKESGKFCVFQLILAKSTTIVCSNKNSRRLFN